MTTLLTVAAYSVAWATFGIGSGWVAAKMPTRRLSMDTFVTRLRPFEFRGRWYDHHLGVRRWKDRLPEAGAVFRGSASKARLPGFSRAHLEAFASETRRAEYVHWANAWFGASFLLWCPVGVGVVMILFGFGVHLPFIVIQRYNRARVDYVLRQPSPTTA